MVGEDIYTIWQIFGPGGLIEKLGPDRAIRELKKRCDAGAIIGCSLYKLLIEKWIDVSTGAKDPGQRGPAEDFMSSAGEDELVKKIEDLHVQYPNGIPRSIRMDVKDEWNAQLEKKVGRRIPLDPKDASKKDIQDSKKIAEQLAAGEGWPRPMKPKVGIEELPPPPPIKPVERAPPRAAPPEVVPTPITVRAVPELELMKKEIEERIEEEKRRRLKRGPIAGESSDKYLIKGAGMKTSMYSGWTYDSFKAIINRTTDIEELMDLAKHTDESGVMTPGDKVSVRQLVEKRKRDIVSGAPEIKKQSVEQWDELKLAHKLRDGDDKKNQADRIHGGVAGEQKEYYISDRELDMVAEKISKLSREERVKIARGIIATMSMPEELPENKKELVESVYKKVIEIEKERGEIKYISLGDIAKLPIEMRRALARKIASGETEIIRESHDVREDDIKKDDDVMQVPGDITEWEFGDFEGQIPGLDDPEDLEILLEYTDVTDKLTKDESKTLREMIKERIRKVEKAGS